MRSLKLPILALTFAADAWLPANAPAHWHWRESDTAGTAVDYDSWNKQPVLVAPAVFRFIRRWPKKPIGGDDTGRLGPLAS